MQTPSIVTKTRDNIELQKKWNEIVVAYFDQYPGGCMEGLAKVTNTALLSWNKFHVLQQLIG
jgi:hypothetical protein